MSAETQASGDAREPPYPRALYAWYVVGVLLATYILAYVDREVIALLVPDIKKTLSISDTGMGFLLGGAFALFYVVFGVLIAWFADRGNRRWIIAVGVALWSVMTIACGMATSYLGLFAARVGVGAGEGALNPSAISLMKDYFPPHRLGRAIGLYSAGISSGGGVAFLIGGSLYPAVKAVGPVRWPLLGVMEPWQQVFIWVGIPGLALLALILTIREPPRREFLRRGTRPEGASLWGTLRFVASRRRLFLFVSFGMSVLGIMAYGVGFWIPEFLRRTYQLSPAELGYYIRMRGMILIPFGLAGVFLGGWMADTLQRRFDDGYLRVCLLGFVLLGVGYVGLTLMPTPTLAVLMLIPGTLGGAMMTAAGTAAVVAIAPATMRAQILALYYFVLSLVGLLGGAPSIALLTDHVFHDESKLRYSLAIVGSVASCAGIALLFLARPYFRARIAEARRDPLRAD